MTCNSVALIPYGRIPNRSQSFFQSSRLNLALLLTSAYALISNARLIADRYTFLSRGEVIGSGLAEELGGDDIKRLMAGGAEIGDLRDELGA